MAVITISRESGSDGMDIAKRVAERLGYLLVDKQTIGDLLGQYGLVEFRKVYDSVPAFWEGFDSQKMEQRKITIDMMNRTILALGQHGKVVIVGRGSYLVLAGYDDALNVRIQAPLASRVACIMKDRSLGDRAQAETFVKENDAKREHFIESAYGSHRDKARDFDLVIDTSKVPADRAIALIVDATKDIEKASGADRKCVSAIEVDPVLKGVIDKLFAGN